MEVDTAFCSFVFASYDFLYAFFYDIKASCDFQDILAAGNVDAAFLGRCALLAIFSHLFGRASFDDVCELSSVREQITE